MEKWILFLTLWFGVFSALSVIICCYDKIAAKKWQKSRVPELFLLFLATLGGAVSMLGCMLIIRHKTRHKKFMLGLPAIILLQAGIILYFLYHLWANR